MIDVRVRYEGDYRAGVSGRHMDELVMTDRAAGTLSTRPHSEEDSLLQHASLLLSL